MSEQLKLRLAVIIKYCDNIEVLQRYNFEIENCYDTEEKIVVAKKFLADDYKLE
jgi:hypothetical protein